MNTSPVVLLSGGSRGLGLKTIRALLEHDFTVVTLSRQCTPELERLVEEQPGRLLHLTGNIAAWDDLPPLVARVEKEVGPIEALINNAGIARDGVLATMPPKEIDQLIQVNLTGTLMLTRLVTRQMIARARGNIITISSIVGLRGYAGLSAYAATKAGLDGMTRALARELGPRNIRVNSIAPGYLETEMTGNLDPVQLEQIVRRTPLGRLGRPEDVVEIVLFLLSPAAAFITGQTIVIDGGITC